MKIGHFAWSDRNAGYLALFIRKAAQTLIPEEWPMDTKTPVRVKRIDHKKGWRFTCAITQGGKAAKLQYKAR